MVYSRHHVAPERSELWVPISYQPTSLHVAQPLLRSWYGLRLLQLTSNFDNPTCVIRLWDSLVNSIKQPSSLNEKFHAAADPTWLCFVQILLADCCILHSSSRHKHTQLRLHSNIFFFSHVFTPLKNMHEVMSTCTRRVFTETVAHPSTLTVNPKE